MVRAIALPFTTPALAWGDASNDRIHTQIAPITDMSITDVNQDGNLDVLAVGNSYAPDTQHGWFDASIGWVLLGDGKGGFRPARLSETGFHVDTDAKAILPLNQASGQYAWIIASNSDSLQMYQLNTLINTTVNW